MTRSVVILLALAAVSALGQSPAADSATTNPDVTRAVRGLAAQVEVEYSAAIRPRAEQAPNSPFMVRVAPASQPNRQKIEFVGSVAGEFDLRDYLEREDGQPLTDLPPIRVSVVTHLPPNHGTDLYLSSESWFNWRAYYREILWSVAGLWVAVPVVYLIVRRLRKKPTEVPVAVAAPPPTLEDQLRAALASAAERQLSIAERGTLELLVLRYLAARLDIALTDGADFATTLAALRSRPETHRFVLALERWLHAGGGEAERAHAAAALDELRRTRLDRPAAAPLPAEARP